MAIMYWSRLDAADADETFASGIWNDHVKKGSRRESFKINIISISIVASVLTCKDESGAPAGQYWSQMRTNPFIVRA